MASLAAQERTAAHLFLLGCIVSRHAKKMEFSRTVLVTGGSGFM